MTVQRLESEVASLDAAVMASLPSSSVDRSRLRPLTLKEREILEAHGCRCTAGWKSLYISSDFSDAASWLAQRVSNTTFGPEVVLVMSDSVVDFTSTLPSDIQVYPVGCHRNDYIAHSILNLSSTRCHGNSIVLHTVLGPDTALIGCGHVTCGTRDSKSQSSLPYVLSLSVGPESGGGRSLCLPPQATMWHVTQQLRGVDDKTNRPSHDNSPALQPFQLSQPPSFPITHNILFPGAYIRHTPTVEAVILHPQAAIVAATVVQRTRLFPQARISDGSVVKDCLLQWKTTVIEHSSLHHVFLMECAAAGPASVLAHAVLGPDVHVAAGEVHASILGPNTAAHHQSLCIGLLWPTGRGNIGYGANVGSNHTGRLPDQEAVAAEGCFWGLSCVVVLPVHLGHAPYSVVAAGATLPAGTCLTCPFSLVTNAGHIVPGWVYAKSPYTVVRSAHKFAKRRKAIRHAYYTGWDILRPSVIEFCARARHQLRQGAPMGHSSLVCTDKARTLGIRTYTDLMQRYALQELLDLCLGKTKEEGAAMWMPAVARAVQEAKCVSPLAGVTSPADWAPFPWEEDASQTAAYRRVLLRREFPRDGISWKHWIRQGLQRLVLLEQEFCDAVERSKARDDQRGQAIVPGYVAAHVAASKDPVIQRQRQETVATCQRIQSVLSQLPASTL